MRAAAGCLLALGTLLLLAWTANSCVITAWTHGNMSESVLLDGGFSPAGISDARGSCHCCALCYRQPSCASLSYNSDTGQCELYNTVATYTSLKPDLKKKWTYYVIPGRSKRGQFCRQDWDCTGDGDLWCRGRFCTERSLVSCRTICEEFGCIRHYDVDNQPEVYGWINGTQVKLRCRMSEEGEGYTQIFRNTGKIPFNEDTILEYNLQLDEDDTDENKHQQSLLNLAEVLRESGDDDRYRIQIWVARCKSCDGARIKLFEYEAPRTETVLSDAPRLDAELMDVKDCDNNLTYNLIYNSLKALGALPEEITGALTVNTPYKKNLLCKFDEVAIYINK